MTSREFARERQARGEIGLSGSQIDTSTNLGLHTAGMMYQIKICEAKLDYLVVRQTDEHKSQEWMPGAGSVGTNPGLHAQSRMS
jgi:hypothetical protein